MKICVFGAGAIGGHLAARLAAAGHEVCVLVREEAARAMNERGLTLEAGEETLTTRVAAATDPAALGPQDVVFVTLKATALAGIGPELAPLLEAETPVVFVLNGIPWWYFHGLPDAETHRGLRAAIEEPGLNAVLDVSRIIGCVVFSSNEVVAPGVVRNRSTGRNEWTLGEIDAGLSERARGLADLLSAAGLTGRAVPDIRRYVWEKLVVTNLGRAPICVILDRDLSVFDNPELQALARAMMREGAAVAAAWEVPLDVDLDTVFTPENMTSGHAPSLLQDFRLGRRMEIDAMIGSVQQFARSADVSTPHIDTVAALLKQRAADRGVYP